MLYSEETLVYKLPRKVLTFKKKTKLEGGPNTSKDNLQFWDVYNAKEHTRPTKSDTCDTVVPEPAPKYNTFVPSFI